MLVEDFYKADADADAESDADADTDADADCLVESSTSTLLIETGKVCGGSMS